MAAVEQFFDHFGARSHLIDTADLKGDLIEFHDFDLELAAPAGDDAVTDAASNRLDGDVNVGGKVL